MNLVFASGFCVPQRIFGAVDYFRGLPQRFPDALFPEVPVDAHVKDRAQVLATQINQRFPSGPIHVIAHSMGGLDTRFLLFNNLLGLASRILSLQTVSTPHRGSPVADLLLELPGVNSRLVGDALNLLPSVGSGALEDLSTAKAREFNQQILDVPGVTYISYFGADNVSPLLQPTHELIELRGQTEDERINDGIVSRASAKWPTDLAEPDWPADHLAQIGHNLAIGHSFDHLAAFDRLIGKAAGIESARAAGAGGQP